MNKWITIGVLLCCGVILISWDIYVAVNATPGDTISELALSFAGRHPILPFSLGVIVGHLFWPQAKKY